MKPYAQYTKQERTEELTALRERLQSYQALKLNLNMARGKPSKAQLDLVSDLLTEEEAAYYRRGRNAHPHGIPKNSTPAQYSRATGLEALFGALFLLGRMERANELFLKLTEVPHAL